MLRFHRRDAQRMEKGSGSCSLAVPCPLGGLSLLPHGTSPMDSLSQVLIAGDAVEGLAMPLTLSLELGDTP